MKSKLVVFFWAAFSISTTLAFAHVPIPPKKGDSGRLVHVPVLDFTLVDQEGKPFRLSSLRGKAVLVTFVYTTCPDVCPLFTAKFAEIQRQLKKIPGDNYFLLTITVAPEVDSPKVLKSYGQRFGADFRTWAFLTGDKEDLSKVWNAFGMAVQRRGKGLVAHTELTTLIDTNGIRRINYFGHKWSVEEARRDILKFAN